MYIFYKLGLYFSLILIFGVAVPPAAAANVVSAGSPSISDSRTYGVDCTDSTCTLSLAGAGAQLPGIARAGATYLLETLQKNVLFLPQGSRLTISDDLILRLPIGDFRLLDADLAAELATDGTVLRLRGTGRVPLPVFGVELFADLGIDQGRNLSALHPLLMPDRRYLFLRMSEVRTGGAGSQQLTLIANLSEPFFWVKGDLQVRGPALAALAMPEILGLYTFSPLRGSLNLQVNGQIVPRANDSYLQIDSTITLAPALLNHWLGGEAQPVATAGSLRFDHDGVLFRTTANARIAPEAVLDSQVELEVFVPFSHSFWQTYVRVGGNAALPLLNTELGASSRLEVAALAALFDGSLWSQLAYQPPGVTVLVKDVSNGAVVMAGRGLQSARNVAVNGYEWTIQSAGSVTDNVLASYESAKDVAGSGYRWVAESVAGGASYAADAVHENYERAGRATTCSLTRARIFWCKTTGLCGVPAECGDSNSD
ncbi:MAG: hypothetical protein DCC55_04610 [Chloroflexi bacterium]|nr:MAG: hypothetical protein DCC55_04610 [Chloroflexota bacterium]